ncbi:hypothetical protein J6590_075110 [Homalodisca vitripennis]|nr:hypothetical protein J6590_075110 [Homalodisca vitripennis]
MPLSKVCQMSRPPYCHDTVLLPSVCVTDTGVLLWSPTFYRFQLPSVCVTDTEVLLWSATFYRFQYTQQLQDLLPSVCVTDTGVLLWSATFYRFQYTQKLQDLFELIAEVTKAPLCLCY